MTQRARHTGCALLALVAVAGCQGAIRSGDGPLSLAAVDPDLLENARTLVFSFSSTRSCGELVDRSPAAIGEALSGENVPLQPVDNDGDVSHVFGDVPADVPVAFLVLASAASRDEIGQRIELADLSGTVFALACRDHRATGGTRVDLPLTLFPVGLR